MKKLVISFLVGLFLAGHRLLKVSKQLNAAYNFDINQMESQRQKKISILIQKDISNIIQSFFREKVRSTFIVSVTKAKVSPDLSICKIYLSVFPSVNSSSVLSLLNKNKSLIKKRLSVLVRNQLRIIPEIIFFIDDSLDYIEKIDDALKGKGDNRLN